MVIMIDFSDWGIMTPFTVLSSFGHNCAGPHVTSWIEYLTESVINWKRKHVVQSTAHRPNLIIMAHSLALQWTQVLDIQSILYIMHMVDSETIPNV